MKLVVIGNQDTVWGFALAGVGGQIVTTPQQVNQALDAVLGDPQVGIVLITEDVATMARQRVDTLMVRSTAPLVVEIPGPAGPSAERPSLSELVRQTIGVRI